MGMCHSLKSQPTDWRSGGSNPQPLVHKASGLSKKNTPAPQALLCLTPNLSMSIVIHHSVHLNCGYLNCGCSLVRANSDILEKF